MSDLIFDPTKRWSLPEAADPDTDEQLFARMLIAAAAPAAATLGDGWVTYDLLDGAGPRFARLAGMEYQDPNSPDVLVELDEYTHTLIPRTAILDDSGESDAGRQARAAARAAIAEIAQPELRLRHDVDFDGIFPVGDDSRDTLTKSASLEGTKDIIFVTATFDPELGLPSAADIEPYIARHAHVEEITEIGQGVAKIAVASKFRVGDLVKGLMAGVAKGDQKAVNTTKALITAFAGMPGADQVKATASVLGQVVSRALAFAGVDDSIMRAAQSLAVTYNPDLQTTTQEKADAAKANANPGSVTTPAVSQPGAAPQASAPGAPTSPNTLNAPQAVPSTPAVSSTAPASQPQSQSIPAPQQGPRTDDLTLPGQPGQPYAHLTQDLSMASEVQSGPRSPGGKLRTLTDLAKNMAGQGRSASQGPMGLSKLAADLRMSAGEIVDRLRLKVVAVMGSRVYVRVRWSGIKDYKAIEVRQYIARAAGEAADAFVRTSSGVPYRDSGVIQSGVGLTSLDDFPSEGEAIVVFAYSTYLGNMGSMQTIDKDPDQVRMAQAQVTPEEREQGILELGVSLTDEDEPDGVDAEAATTQREMVRRLSPADMQRGHQNQVTQQTEEQKAKARRQERTKEQTNPGATQRPSWLTATLRRV